MPGKPLGEGLGPAYRFVRETCPWARVACALDAPDFALKTRADAPDDWYLDFSDRDGQALARAVWSAR